MNFLKYIYNWVLRLADKPNGNISLSILSFSEASFFPIPPDVLLIPLCIGNRSKALSFALLCRISSIFGAIIGYYIGKLLWWDVPGIEYSYIANIFINHVPGVTTEGLTRIQTLYEQWNFWIVFTAGFTPIPFKLITLSAGTFNIDFFMFVIASMISRSARFFLVAYLIKIYGEAIRDFIENYFNYLAILFTVLLLGGFVIIKYIIS